MRHRVGGHDRMRPRWTCTLITIAAERPRLQRSGNAAVYRSGVRLDDGIAEIRRRVESAIHQRATIVGTSETTVPYSSRVLQHFAGVAFLGSESSLDRAQRLRNLLETTCR